MEKPNWENAPAAKSEKAEVKKLPAVEVKNEVLWTNKKVAMPFNFEEGKSTKVGLFLTPKPQEGQSVFEVEIMDDHFRSALLGRAVFADKKNSSLRYRDVDLKGGGGLDALSLEVEKNAPHSWDPEAENRFRREETPWGFSDQWWAEKDRDLSEFFLKKGLRTHRVLAIIKLKEIIGPDGEKVSVSKARKLRYIKTNAKPVVEVRAFGVKSRIRDAQREAPKGRRELVDDAKIAVARELGIKPEDFSDEEYLKWFADVLGKQLAIIHGNGYAHCYLTAHNVTLDCRIVDFDTALLLEDYESKREELLKGDYGGAEAVTEKLAGALGLASEKFISIFKRSYTESSSLQK